MRIFRIIQDHVVRNCLFIADTLGLRFGKSCVEIFTEICKV